MANEQNLKPFTSEQSREEAVRNGRKGGIASGEAKRKRKTFAQAFDAFLSSEFEQEDGITLSGTELIAKTVIDRAKEGDLKAFELIRDTVGEKPIDKVAKVDITPEVRNEVEALVEKYETGHGDQDT